MCGALVWQAAVCDGQPPPSKAEGSPGSIHRQVPEGTPLRLYIAKRVWFRLNAPVTAALIEPLWAFDQVVVPVGTIAKGHISSLQNIPKMARAAALLNGDFTPLKKAEVTFTELTFPDGRTMSLDTEPSLGLATIYSPKRQVPNASKKPKSAGGNSVRVRLEQQVKTEITARTVPVVEAVRGKNKKEWLGEFLLSKLPYHPQWYRARTRFDAELRQPLEFGIASAPQERLAGLGSLSTSGNVAQLRLLSAVTSLDAQRGDAVEAILSQPIYSSSHMLVLPEGTRFSGKVTLTQRARYFHRSGKIRFSFDSVRVPQIGLLPPELEGEGIQGQLAAIEANSNAVKIDGEGTAKAAESKTRLLELGLAGLIAANAADPGGETAAGVTATTTEAGNVGGRALGGFSGLGLVGTAMSFGPRAIGVGLGYYGLAWSAYSNVIARGSETVFKKNTAMVIHFGPTRTAATSEPRPRVIGSTKQK
jgi:hypothetical protein